ncbi:MAG: hypothetical protein M0Z31_07450 [Clostridia bacterium]|nr:hypothetical protein [Clostridia bacterium]
MKQFVKFLAIWSLLFLGGCIDRTVNTDNPKNSLDPQMTQEWLTNDAHIAFEEALKGDYTRLTIIAGSLKKLPSTNDKEGTLGVALGAIEATVFSTPYEYRRLTDNENIPVEVKKDLAPPGLLKILNQNHLTLEHIYENILKPLAELQKSNRPLTAVQQKKWDKATENIYIITNSYGILSRDNPKASKEEIQTQIIIITKAQNELKRLSL